MTLQVTYKKQGKLDTTTKLNQADFSYTIGTVIKEARTRMHCSMRELSRRTGISTTVLSKIEKGIHPCPPKTIFRCLEALRIKRETYEEILLACAEPYHGVPNISVKSRLEKTLIEYGIPIDKLELVTHYLDYVARTS